jgi:two-component system NtrC family sensor kinase
LTLSQSYQRKKIDLFLPQNTSSGTVLGLNMSYDIITKGHGGELKVESKVGEETEFIIHLKK